MASPASVQKILASSPVPLTASTISELLGSDSAVVQVALTKLASDGLARRVNSRWVAAGSAKR